MKFYYLSNFVSLLYIILVSLTVFIFVTPPAIDACDVMGARACGQKPEKEDRESDPIKYCVASRVYFECVHKKYRGCETKEKYENAMESIMKGIRKRVDDLMAFCSEKIEDYKFNIVWDVPKQAEAADSVRNGGHSQTVSVGPKNGIGSAPIAPKGVPDDACQVKAINDLCQPLMITVKFNPSWNSANKRGWCQQATIYFRCLKSRLDKCPQSDVQNQFQQLEHYLQSQININCPGGIDGCTRHSNDARCKIGTPQSSGTASIYCLAVYPMLTVQSVLSLLLSLLLS